MSRDGANDQDESTPAGADPRSAYAAALRGYDQARLGEIYRALEPVERLPRASALPDAIADRLSSRVAEEVAAGLDDDARLVLGLLALVEATSWPAAGLARSLRLLGVDPLPPLTRLLETGLLAAGVAPDRVPVKSYAELLEGPGAAGVRLVPHPEARAVGRTVRPSGELAAVAGPVRQVREADGLEPVLRLGTLWQRVDEDPLRQTQQGTLYKRDRERLEEDIVLAGAISDTLEPLPDMAPLWLELARGVGLIVPVPGTDRLAAAPAEFWGDNAVHLPQMIAARWLGLWRWQESGGFQEEGATATLSLPFARVAALLWLATAGLDDWVALDELDALLERQVPGWGRPSLEPLADPVVEPPRSRGGRGRGKEPIGSEAGPLAALLLGPAYVLGLVRAAEAEPGGRRVVQLTPLGRYVLALGPPPLPRPEFPHFLYVQPNFEVIAYRQGLTPWLVGQFSRFLRWEQLGAALELKLTPESVYRGLEGGLSPEGMLERLQKHSARPLPAGVAESLRTWSSRRDRVSVYAAATLIEFATADDRAAALDAWPADGRPAPLPVGDRLLLVEDESAIPWGRFRQTASRDYRRPPEACVEVDPDGVTLSVDLNRSDLLIDAELARFAQELPVERSRGGSALPRRRFLITRETLAAAQSDGMGVAALERWFSARTGGPMPPALRLLMHGSAPSRSPFRARRPLVLHLPSADLLDGLAQYPATRDCLGERLGPTTVIIPEDAVDRLRRGLAGLGIGLDDSETG